MKIRNFVEILSGSLIKDIESWPVFEPVLGPSVTDVANVKEQVNNSLSRVPDNTPVVDPVQSKNSLGDEPSQELDLDPSIEYQIGSQIYFGDDLYEVCQTNVNGKNQIALVLIETEIETPQQNAQGIASQDQSQANRQKSWKSQSSGSFDSAIESSFGSSLGSSCQDYQQEVLQNSDETVYTTRSVNESDPTILPPAEESIRPGKRPKITDNEVSNVYLTAIPVNFIQVDTKAAGES